MHQNVIKSEDVQVTVWTLRHFCHVICNNELVDPKMTFSHDLLVHTHARTHAHNTHVHTHTLS